MAIVRSLSVYEAPAGVSPLSRLPCRWSDARYRDISALICSLSAVVVHSTFAEGRSAALAVRRILPGVVVERTKTRLTPASTGRVVARM